MSKELMEKKFGIIFDFLDVERDGILTLDELMLYPRRLQNSPGKEHLGYKLEELYMELWKRVHASIGNHEDEAVCLRREDFVKNSATVRDTTWFRETYVKTVTNIYFDSIDLNQDGSITLKEWSEYYTARGISDPNFIKSTFQKMDFDGNGGISREEFIKAFALFSLSEDPENSYCFLYDIKSFH